MMARALANRVKCTILYATETGKAETYARRLCEIFKHAFDARVGMTFSNSSYKGTSVGLLGNGSTYLIEGSGTMIHKEIAQVKFS